MERFGGHKGAGGLAVKLENLPALIERFEAYCQSSIQDVDIVKIVKVDTKVYGHEWNNETLAQIQKLAPFGEKNPEPVFILEDITIQKVEKVGSNGKSHLKIHGLLGNQKITSMFRGKGEESDNISQQEMISLIGKIKKDTYN